MTSRCAACLFCLVLSALLVVPAPTSAQQTRPEDTGMSQIVPPPLPPKKPRVGTRGNYKPVLPESDAEWGLDPELLTSLLERARVYQAYTRRFSCTETARLADYDSAGGVSDERKREYGYLLTKSEGDDIVREYRQQVGRNGQIKGGQVQDAEPFPPAYAWVFMFTDAYEPYFSFRNAGDRFEGFDWIYEIHFKGSLPFTDGKDIRQWEGVALVDAVTFTPLEIVAEPSGQRDRIEALYRRWSRSFNFMGLRTAPRPYAYRARIEFRLRREGLTFPTQLRYDTYRAVGVDRIVAAKASTRSYTDYRIFKVHDEQAPGEKVEP